MGTTRQKLRLWPHWFMALSTRAGQEKLNYESSWLHFRVWCAELMTNGVLILRILSLGSDGNNPNRDRRKLEVGSVLKHGCPCHWHPMSFGPVFLVGENNPGTVWQHGWFNWLAAGAQYCHIISNSHKTEFFYLQNIWLLSSRPDCLNFF